MSPGSAGVGDGRESFNSIDGSDFDGVTLRLFDPTDRLWRIWWASSSRPGQLDPPLEGGFVGTHGVFHGTDTVTGTPVNLRFDWHVDIDGPDSASWSQSISTDSGAHWHTDFTTHLERA